MPRPLGLSKSRFTSGLQCHKQLWWRVHEPDAPELTPDESQQAIFDQGTRVGEVARRHVSGGVLIDRRYDDYDGRLAETKRAIDSGANVIYEGAFAADSVFVAVDILVREPHGWRVIEVKSSTSVKPVHLPDAAIQVHVLRRAGLRVSGVDVMVLNRACTFPDLSDLFLRHDVTAEVEALLANVASQAAAQLVMLGGPLPGVAIGPHCNDPYVCPFKSRCWAAVPEHHVSTLYYIGRRAAELEAQGYHTIDQLPEGLDLRPAAERQRRAVQTGQMIIDGNLGAALAQFKSPLAFLDFETVQFAIPIWKGCHPYDQIAAQFSCHLERPGDKLSHLAWAPDSPGDPRPEMAKRVVEACKGARTVVAYNAGFEKGCLASLAAAVPVHAAALNDIIDRLADPLPVVRDHVYHPDFGGSFSLKSVLPALVPELDYSDLEIQDGALASRILTELVVPESGLSPEDRARRRDALLRYCERDTLAMVKVLARLHAIAREG